MKDDLVQMRDTENNNGTIDQIDFTLKYIDTPKGDLSIPGRKGSSQQNV